MLLPWTASRLRASDHCRRGAGAAGAGRGGKARGRGGRGGARRKGGEGGWAQRGGCVWLKKRREYIQQLIYATHKGVGGCRGVEGGGKAGAQKGGWGEG